MTYTKTFGIKKHQNDDCDAKKMTEIIFEIKNKLDLIFAQNEEIIAALTIKKE